MNFYKFYLLDIRWELSFFFIGAVGLKGGQVGLISMSYKSINQTPNLVYFTSPHNPLTLIVQSHRKLYSDPYLRTFLTYIVFFIRLSSVTGVVPTPSSTNCTSITKFLCRPSILFSFTLLPVHLNEGIFPLLLHKRH